MANYSTGVEVQFGGLQWREKPYLFDEMHKEFLWQEQTPFHLWIWSAYLAHIQRVGDQYFKHIPINQCF
jgi:hypothetical protein